MPLPWRKWPGGIAMTALNSHEERQLPEDCLGTSLNVGISRTKCLSGRFEITL